MGPRDDDILSDYRKMYEVSEKQKCFENNVISSTCHRNASKTLCFCMFQNMRNVRFLDKISSEYRKMYEVSEKQKCFENNAIPSTCHRTASKTLCFCMFQNMRNV